mgnify:CR=1 FL=1
MPRFTKGQRVRFTDYCGNRYSAELDLTGRCGRVLDNSPLPWVEFDDHVGGDGPPFIGAKAGHCVVVNESSLELIDTEVSPPVPPKISGGVKYDDGKPRYDLMPPDAENAIAKILTFGAEKYADRNWEDGMNWGRLYGAARRHLSKYWAGENYDSDSGELHLAHAACCVMMLLSYQLRNVGTDTRNVLPPKTEG